MAVLPVRPVVFPSTLTGKENGKLPASVLAQIGIGTAVMEITAARAFRAMFAAARAELGVTIRQVGDYRTFNAQLSLFVSRYKPVTRSVYDATPSAHRKQWPQASLYGYTSEWWVKKDNTLATAAVPGTSNHGWGLALDIAEEYDTDPDPDGITDRFVNWLIANAARFGISAELQSEPWHWRYVTGDAIPAAVLAYEGDDDMIPLDVPDRVYDSRPDPYGPHPAGVKVGEFAPGETRTIPLGMCTRAFVHITAVGVEPGYVSISGTATPSAASITNVDADGIASGGAPVGVPDGKLRVRTSGRCHIIVDVYARGA